MKQGREDLEVVEPEELRRMLEQQTPVQVLDIRPAEERAEWSIPGSLYRDVYVALKAGDESALDGLPLEPDQAVVTVCARGRTSAIAARALRRRGYSAFSLAGGMKSWSLAWNTAELAVRDTAMVQVRRTGKG